MSHVLVARKVSLLHNRCSFKAKTSEILSGSCQIGPQKPVVEILTSQEGGGQSTRLNQSQNKNSTLTNHRCGIQQRVKLKKKWTHMCKVECLWKSNQGWRTWTYYTTVLRRNVKLHATKLLRCRCRQRAPMVGLLLLRKNPNPELLEWRHWKGGRRNALDENLAEFRHLWRERRWLPVAGHRPWSLPVCLLSS